MNPEERRKLGKRARAYVNNFRASRSVAERYLSIIQKKVPLNWYLDPFEQDYMFGGGQEISETRRIISELTNKYGYKSLGLNHNIRLLKSLIDEFK